MTNLTLFHCLTQDNISDIFHSMTSSNSVLQNLGVYVAGRVGQENAKIVRIVHISDTHGLHHDLIPHIPMAHILIHSGNFCHYRRRRLSFDIQRERERQLARMSYFFNKLPHLCKIFVPGREDGILHSMTPAEVQQFLPSDVIYLYDSSCTAFGLQIYGSPWSISSSIFHNQGFVQRPSFVLKKWSKIPEETDVLVTHMAPWCKEKLFNEVTQRIKPVVHLFSDADDSPGIRWKSQVLFSNGSLFSRHGTLIDQVPPKRNRSNSTISRSPSRQGNRSESYKRLFHFITRIPSKSLSNSANKYVNLYANSNKDVPNPITLDVYAHVQYNEFKVPPYHYQYSPSISTLPSNEDSSSTSNIPSETTETSEENLLSSPLSQSDGYSRPADFENPKSEPLGNDQNTETVDVLPKLPLKLKNSVQSNKLS